MCCFQLELDTCRVSRLVGGLIAQFQLSWSKDGSLLLGTALILPQSLGHHRVEFLIHCRGLLATVETYMSKVAAETGSQETQV